MKTYLQFKDNIVFAYTICENEIEGAMELPNNLQIEDVIYKKYNNGEWIDPEVIRYIDKVSNLGNRILSISETFFSSEVSGEIVEKDIQCLYVLHNGKWFNEEDLKKEIMPTPDPSWIWNSELLVWQPPVPMPTEGGPWFWNEETVSWLEIPYPTSE